MKRIITAAAAVLLFPACEKAPERDLQANGQNGPASAVPEQTTTPAPTPPEPGTPGGLPDDKTPLPEPRGAIDPKSPEAAGQVVQHYGALIEQKRFAEAEKLWNDASAAKQASGELKTYSEAHLQIGKPTDMEGAAGSSYITVPIVLYGKLVSDASRHRSGSVILRRVNDVPGSTEAQRRWHIERIEWKS